MNLKPFRDYSEHEVTNLFSLNVSSGNKGSVVAVVPSTTYVNGAEFPNFGANLTPSVGPVSPRFAVRSKVELAGPTTAATALLGVMIYDVREFDENGEKLIFQPAYKKAEICAVSSGEAVPIVSRGLLYVGGISGTPGPGSGAYVAAGGVIASATGSQPLVGQKIGKFLSAADADGYALLKVEL